jgi:hypothetical protein
MRIAVKPGDEREGFDIRGNEVFEVNYLRREDAEFHAIARGLGCNFEAASLAVDVLQQRRRLDVEADGDDV